MKAADSARGKATRRRFRGTNNAAQVTIDSQFVTFGVFMGGVLSASVGRYARLYVAGGPSATWGWLDDDSDEVQPVQGSNVIVLDGSDSDVSFVAYGRAGVECVLEDGFAFGVSVRYADDEFDFGNGGKLRFNEPLWLLTLGARL